MITLATLPTATTQEIFTQVATHLLTQNAKSLALVNLTSDEKSCAYRGDNGMKCAAGCLIADEEYNPAMMEGNSWYWISDELGLNTMDERTLIISALQNVHDQYAPDSWRDMLQRIAHEYKLVMP